MIDLKRLHKVHNNYPNTYRREGKSTYCFDSLLRCAQTGYYKSLCYVTNTYEASEYSLNDFMEFLYNAGEKYTVSSDGVVELYDTEITFLGKDSTRKDGFDGYIEDYFAEEKITPQYKLDEIEDWSRRQLTRSVYR
jgi:hypothetical protein